MISPIEIFLYLFGYSLVMAGGFMCRPEWVFRYFGKKYYCERCRIRMAKVDAHLKEQETILETRGI